MPGTANLGRPAQAPAESRPLENPGGSSWDRTPRLGSVPFRNQRVDGFRGLWFRFVRPVWSSRPLPYDPSAGGDVIRSSGTVRLRSADPFAAPEIDPRYLSQPEDLQVIAHGIELARKVASMPAFEGIAGAELEPGEAPVNEWIRSRAHTLYHPVGTCRMGAVVDAELRVRGIEGLRVVDASVIPRVPRGHTHLPTLMVAERAAELLRGGARREPQLLDASV